MVLQEEKDRNNYSLLLSETIVVCLLELVSPTMAAQETNKRKSYFHHLFLVLHCINKSAAALFLRVGNCVLLGPVTC